MDYTSGVRPVVNFEWDQRKSEACLRERGFDFTYAAHAFADPWRRIRPDHRYTYGEDRFQLLGSIDGRVFALVFTRRGDAFRIISARRANQREVKRYENRPKND
jgi:uncharacterized DUF497 family protein